MRIRRDQMMMEMAEVVAKRGTCQRLHVGAIISHEGRVMSMGYNGAPAGMDHCNHTLDEENGCDRAVHAEANAIAWAARTGVATEGCTMTVTHMPCLKCAQLIINAGIKVVVYKYPYRITDGIALLAKAGIRVVGAW